MALDIARSFSDLSPQTKTCSKLNDTDLERDGPELVAGVHQLLSVNDTKSCPRRIKDVSLAREPKATEEMNTAAAPQHSPIKRASHIPTSRVPVGKSKYVERKPLTCKPTHTEKPLAQVRKTLSEMEAQLERRIPVSTSTREPFLTFDHGSKLARESKDHLDRSPALGSSYNFSSGNAVKSSPASSAWKPLRDQPSIRPDNMASISGRQNLSNPPAEDFRSLNVTDQVRPKSLSTPRYSCSVAAPVYSFHLPKSSGSKIARYQSPLREKTSHNSLDKSLEIKAKPMSSYQSDYWACVLPTTLPPSQNRQSPHWNPHKEYEDLLDYTYPLKPKHSSSREAVKETLVYEPLVHDSGIDLDSFSISPDSTVRSTATSFIDHYTASGNYSRTRETRSPYVDTGFPQRASSPVETRCAFVKSASTFDFPDSFEEHFEIYEAKPSSCCASSSPVFCSNGETSLADRRLHRNSVNISSLKSRALASGYVPATWLLPLNKEWESDEDYLSLPSSLKELDVLAQHLQNLSVEIKPHCDSKKNLENALDTSSEDSSSTLHLEEYREMRNDSVGSKNEIQDLTDSDTDYSLYSDQEDCSLDSAKDHDGDNIFGSLKKVSSLMDRLSGTAVSNTSEYGIQLQGNQRDQEKEESLVQHIQKFCCKLEELIQWLYKVNEMTTNWVPPQPDAESVKSSLERYMAFKKDVVEHQTLADTILGIGERLLTCMTSVSPGVKDALGLIEKQAEELDRHAEDFYASILSAMDNMKEDTTTKSEAQDEETAQTAHVT